MADPKTSPETRSIADMLSDFEPSAVAAAPDVKYGRAITIWVPGDYKARYDRLQKRSGRKFCKKVREILKAAIDLAEKRAS